MSTVARVYTSVRGFTVAIKDVSRFREIVQILVKHGFGAIITRLNLTETIGVKSLMEYTDDEDNTYSTPQRVRMAIEELGPTFIKLGQILSTRGDLVPMEVVAELSMLQDEVPEMSWEDVVVQVEAELGGSVDKLYTDFVQKPLACASIAQVHRAKLAGTDTPVVVKVQRRNIADRIDSDLNILDFLARRAEAFVPELQLMDPVGIVGEFDKAIRKEIDFRNEIQHLRKFATNFEGYEGVRIPAVYTELSTARVLTMEFIGGVKVTRAPDEFGVDPYEIAPRMLHLLFKMIFKDGYFHGDLHPGNILVDGEGSIGLIDFGLVGRLSDSQRENIMDIIIAMIHEDYEALARGFFDVGIKVPGVRYDFAAFQQDVVDVMQKHLEGRTLNDIDVGAYFGDLVAGAIRHQIKMPPSYTMVFKALMTIEGIGKMLAPNLNLLEEAKPVVRDLLVERYDPRRMLRQGIDTLGAFSKFLRQFPVTATQLLHDAESGELELQVNIDRMDSLLLAQERQSRRQSQAILAAGSALAGAVAMQAGEGVLLGLNGPAFILFAVAVALGGPLVLGALRRVRRGEV
jgi:ubiquinone biosynthesis protein